MYVMEQKGFMLNDAFKLYAACIVNTIFKRYEKINLIGTER